MYILTHVTEDVVISIASDAELRKVLDGEYVSATEDDYEYVYDVSHRSYFPKEMVHMYELDSIPDNVVEGKYCYTQSKGFYENKNYVEPSEPIDLEAIIRKQQEQMDIMQEAIDFILMS